MVYSIKKMQQLNEENVTELCGMFVTNSGNLVESMYFLDIILELFLRF